MLNPILRKKIFVILSKQTFNDMLRYTVEILKKVSFNALLFKRELKKSLDWLLPKEIEILKRWVRRFVIDKPNLQNAISVIH